MKRTNERDVCRKFIFRLCVMLFILPVCLAFSGCGDDDDDENNPLVGSWKMEASSGYEILTFNANKTGRYVTVLYGSEEVVEDESFTYNYDAKGHVIYMTFGDELETWSVDKLTSDVLVTDGYHYQRVK